MTGRSRMSNTDAHRIGRRGERVCRLPWQNACAVALASVLIVGSSGGAVAQPVEGEVFADCVLTGTTVDALKADVGTGFVADGQVAFVIVYTMKDNDGQELAANPGQFTGPVICVNPDADGEDSEFQGVGIDPIDQTDPIPDPAVADAVNTRDAEEVFILRYELVDDEDESEVNGVIEKVLCHAVDNVTFCYRISPLLVELPG